jgi:coatomer protein complex subunit alpha (xenin)
MQMLNRQAAIVNFAPLKDHFLKAALSSHAYVSAFPSLPPLAVPLRRNPDETDLRSLLPIVAYNFRTVVTGPLQEAYKTTTSGKFQEAITHFRDILHTLVLTVVTSAAEADEHKQLVGICREYILGLTIETERKQTSDVKRSLELAAYFTHCKLQPIHQQLSLRSAMVLAYNAKNYASASSFARRLLELQPAANVAAKARHIKTASDKNLRDELPTGYDQYAVFECSAMTYEPIHNGTPSLTCPYCGAHYEPEFRGKLCNVCELSQIGASASGLRVFS